MTPTIIKIEFRGRIARYEENINVMYIYEGIRKGEKIPEINLAHPFNIITTTPFLILQWGFLPVLYIWQPFFEQSYSPFRIEFRIEHHPIADVSYLHPL